MNKLIIILTAVITLFCNSISRADSVIISYADGKTQIVTLDSTVKSITAVQYLSSNGQVLVEPPSRTAIETPLNDTKQSQKQVPSKPTVRFKWADPLIGQ